MIFSFKYFRIFTLNKHLKFILNNEQKQPLLKMRDIARIFFFLICGNTYVANFGSMKMNLHAWNKKKVYYYKFYFFTIHLETCSDMQVNDFTCFTVDLCVCEFLCTFELKTPFSQTPVDHFLISPPNIIVSRKNFYCIGRLQLREKPALELFVQQNIIQKCKIFYCEDVHLS